MKNKEDAFLKADLISRYLRGELSHIENEELIKWAGEDNKNQRLLDDLENEALLNKDLHFISMVDKDVGWTNITRTIDAAAQKRQINIVRYLKYAAAVILVGALSFVVFLMTYKDKRLEVSSIDNLMPLNDALPGGNKATLTLGDGSVVSLEDVSNGTFKEENGIRIRKKDGEVIYEILEQAGNQEVHYNTIQTPVGGQYHVVLPDGSKVWLNSESSLHFPTAFTGMQRTVNLTGEGYFEIAKNTGMPFIVKANNTQVEVLGTHFNVMAYSNETELQTTLLEGSVRISNGRYSKTIMPGQQAGIGKDISVKDVDLDEVVAWKNGYFQFENEDLRSILRQLRRWYNVEVEDENHIPEKHFTAYISRNTTLSQVLKMLEMSGELKFKVEGNKIGIQNNQMKK